MCLRVERKSDYGTDSVIYWECGLFLALLSLPIKWVLWGDASLKFLCVGLSSWLGYIFILLILCSLQSSSIIKWKELLSLTSPHGMEYLTVSKGKPETVLLVNSHAERLMGWFFRSKSKCSLAVGGAGRRHKLPCKLPHVDTVQWEGSRTFFGVNPGLRGQNHSKIEVVISCLQSKAESLSCLFIDFS